MQALGGLCLLLVLKGGAAPPDQAAAPAAPLKPKTTFAVRGYSVDGNTVLPPAKIDAVLSPYTGPAVDLDRLLKGVGELQLLYRNLGYATVSVSVPQQELTNGLVRLRVTEGRLARIRVTGNRHYSSNNIRRALPGLSTNVLLNTKWFQPELDRANANADRQIYPVIAAGTEPGATDLNLQVKDRLPLHGHIEVNNIATPNTPGLRIDSSVQYNNLWQLDHQAGVEYNFSPQVFKGGDILPGFYDEPAVASYSGFYRIPFGSPENLREALERRPADFGYDPVTHAFRPPASTGSPELIFYASRSVSETATRYGPLTVITNTVLADISSQSAERDLITSQGGGAKFTLPLREFAGVRSSFTAGLEFKNFASQTYSTNLTYFQLYALDPAGNRVLETGQTVPLGSASQVNLVYAPLNLGWSGVRPDRRGVTSFYGGENIFLSPLASERTGFQAAAGSAAAGGNYTTLSAGLTREQKLAGDWTAVLRANGQWSAVPLIGNEQFALGGVAGVRGYVDGEEYGDCGWQTQFDLRAPPLSLGSLPNRAGDIPVRLRASCFMDYGEIWHVAPAAPADAVSEWGAGFSLFATAGQHIDARLTLAWALLDTPLTRAGNARAYFRVGCQF